MTVKVLHNLRAEIKAKIDVADEKLLTKINSILIPFENEIIAITMKGKSITSKELEDELLQAEQEMKAGNFITIEELEHKFK